MGFSFLDRRFKTNEAQSMEKNTEELKAIVQSIFKTFEAQFFQEPQKEVIRQEITDLLEKKKKDYIYQVLKDRSPNELVQLYQLVSQYEKPVEPKLTPKVEGKKEHGRSKRDRKEASAHR
jgi:hypothetical protein